MLEWLERRMYRAARHVVTVGEGYRRELLARGVADERLSVIPNGIDRARFAPRDPDLALKRSLGLEGKFVVGYSGTIGMASGLDVVLRAADRLARAGRDDVAFLLVGDGAVREDLAREARARGLARVVFAGRQDPARMPAFLSICDACLVHLRKVELFTTVLPSKIFEAAGMGRPILLGVGGEAREIVERAGCGEYVEPENDGALVEAVLRLAADPARCRALGARGAAYVARHHDRDRSSADYLRLLERVSGLD
jgi:glycosyltransferase involved in cell wall biosynthesis